jgi:hypothetical protein
MRSFGPALEGAILLSGGLARALELKPTAFRLIR